MRPHLSFVSSDPPNHRSRFGFPAPALIQPGFFCMRGLALRPQLLLKYTFCASNGSMNAPEKARRLLYLPIFTSTAPVNATETVVKNYCKESP